MKIFIVGCAKSGTTLLQRLFYSFDNVEVVLGESSLGKAAQSDNNGVKVFKRTHSSIFSHKMPNRDIERQIQYSKDYGINLIYVKRNMKDVLRSSGGIVSEDRYNACEYQLRRFGDNLDFRVMYEGLINYNTSNKIQDKLARKFGLRIGHRFTDYPDFVPDEAFDLIDDPAYSKRKLGAPYRPA